MNKPELISNDKGLFLSMNGMEINCDFQSLMKRIMPQKLNGEMLIKACKFKGKTPSREAPLWAIDCTAGLGEDAFLLAAYGFRVTLLERNTIIYHLLEDGINRALKAGPAELSDIIKRMEPALSDSIEYLHSISDHNESSPDLIYLDPMFPERTKSGLIKKKFQLLQALEDTATDEKELLLAAINCRPRKIVIKRPLKAEYLGDIKPSYSIKGSVIRYDCIVI